MSDRPRKQRRPGRLDVAASLLTRVLPSAAAPHLDQARLDLGAVVDGMAGRRPSPARNGQGPWEAPAPLDAIDPVDRLLPRTWSARVQRARRDTHMILRGLRGLKPSPLVDRPPRPVEADVARPAPSAPGPTPRAMRVARVVRETKDAISIYLEDPSGQPVSFLPGQFLTVLVDVDGQSLRRAYSLASPALPGAPPHVTVKRIPDGRVSNFLNDHLEAGQTLRVLGPSGSFTVQPDPEAERHLVMLAGGSGITPIMSIAHTVLAREPRSRVTLIYGNRGQADIIFRERLDALVREHGDRFRVDHVLSDPPAQWTGGKGLLDEATVAARLEAVGCGKDDGAHFEYFVCGPTPMMDSVRAALATRGVPASRVREERFVRPEERSSAPSLPSDPQPVHVQLGGRAQSLIAQPGQTLLEAGMAAGMPMPFSCTMGGCGACRVRLVEGQVDSEEPNCLTDAEKAQGYVLACVSRPCSSVSIQVED
ncbi:MAG: 2Fe-2S iron-sulfur cluster-binding protein [Myxococcota bacterium]